MPPASSSSTVPIPIEGPPGSTLGNELSRLEQALADLKRCEGSEVVLLRCGSREAEQELIENAARRSRRAGFVTAVVSLEQHALEALDGIVREIVLGLTPPTRSGASTQQGLLVLLDAFVRRHGGRSLAQFDDRTERLRAAGDLTLLCRSLLESSTEPKKELVAFNAWLSGTELSRRVRAPVPRAALSPKTARRALGEVTRIVRALGFAGCALFLTSGDRVARRTPRQREKGYTVLRELIDNFDVGRGMMATRLTVTGLEPLFVGERSLHSVAPLAGRLAVPSHEAPAPPHRSSASLSQMTKGPSHDIAIPAQGRQKALRALVRISQGLPPTEAVASLSVGHERIDAVIDRLFEHAEMDGSVFTVLTGDYGTGKTHLLMHLSERALSHGHPVFRLDVERLNLDLGNPQRHLARLLDHSILPLRHRPSALERAAFWTRSPTKLPELLRALEAVAEEPGDASSAATRALSQVGRAKDPGPALESFLTARGLERKTSAPNYRQDAYERLLLWLELLARLDGSRGPVVLIDEAENLYTTGAARSLRRTALRSLSFYCGGALPSACVVIAITPRVLKQLRADARDLLGEVSEQRTVLPWEDATMLSRRLSRIKPEPVPEFSDAHRRELLQKVIETHRGVRGASVALTKNDLRELAQEPGPPRRLLRKAADELERRWWAGSA